MTGSSQGKEWMSFVKLYINEYSFFVQCGSENPFFHTRGTAFVDANPVLTLIYFQGFDER